jgi:L-lysine 6-transaminase
MVRSARFLEIVAEERLIENARVVGDHLLAGLRALERELGGLISNSRGLGLMIAFDLPSPEARDAARRAIVANGLLLLPCGTRSIRFRPPLDLSAAEADTGLEILRKTLRALPPAGGGSTASERRGE